MIYAFDDFELDAQRLELRRHGAVLKVDRVVLRVLAVLVRNAGRLVTKDELVEEVWDGRALTDNVLTVSMARLRRALQDRRGKHEYVVTIYGLGYRFVRPVASKLTGAEAAPLAVIDAASEGVLPMVGRSAIMAELTRGLAHARRGRGRLFALSGAAGVGKTRVVSALTDELGDETAGFSTAWGFCRESGSTPPLYPWLQLSRKLLASASHEHWERVLGPLASELRALLDGERASSDPPAAPPHRSIEIVSRAFILAAEASPWILVLEDLHRADSASIEVLSALIDEIGRAPLLVITTLRDSGMGSTLRPSTSLPHVLGHSNTERIALKPLDEASVLGYVASFIDDFDHQFGRAVFDKSQGNPFLMTELMSQIRRDQTLMPEQLTFPSSALELVRQRVAVLPLETRRLLSAAAVVGTRFELSILQKATGESPGTITDALDEAIATDLLIASPDSPTAFSFGHDLIRTSLYQDMPLAERRRRHHETALAMEQHAAEAFEPVPVGELADQFFAALPETDLEKTVHYCERAAHIAGAAFANTDAARHLRQALQALSLMPAPAVTHRMDLLLALALYTRGSAAEVSLASIREVIRLARESGDAKRLIRGAMMCQLHPEFSAVRGATEALEHALTIIPADKPGLRATVLAVLATATPRMYATAERSACLAEAEALARRAPWDECLQVVLTCKLFSEAQDTDAAFHALTSELDRLAKRRPHRTPVVPLFIELHRAVRLLQQGQLPAAQASIERGKAYARKVRHPELLWYFERFDALAHINHGASVAGSALLHRLHRQAEQRPVMGSPAFCGFDRAVVLPELGVAIQVDDALRRDLCFQLWDAPGIWALKVRALAAAGMLDEARSSLAAVAAHRLAELPHDSQYLGTLGHLTHAVLSLGLTDYALALESLLAPLDGFACHASYFCEGSVPLLRGMLLRRLGRLSQAQPLLERGLSASERAGFMLAAAQARLELGGCLLDLGSEGAAKSAAELARQASVVAAQCGFDRTTQRAAQLTDEATTPRRVRRPTAHGAIRNIS